MGGWTLRVCVSSWLGQNLKRTWESLPIWERSLRIEVFKPLTDRQAGGAHVLPQWLSEAWKWPWSPLSEVEMPESPCQVGEGGIKGLGEGA